MDDYESKGRGFESRRAHQEKPPRNVEIQRLGGFSQSALNCQKIPQNTGLNLSIVNKLSTHNQAYLFYNVIELYLLRMIQFSHPFYDLNFEAKKMIWAN